MRLSEPTSPSGIKREASMLAKAGKQEGEAAAERFLLRRSGRRRD